MERCHPSVRQWFSTAAADELYVSGLVAGEICRVWGGMSLARPLPPIDGLMAAAAVHHGTTSVTHDIDGVERPGADVLDPARHRPAGSA